MIDLHQLPAWPQSQEPLAEQMAALVQVANRLGLYDAADSVRQLMPRLHEVKYGCHVDLEPGEQPDGCVIDEERPQDCIYAKPGMRKEQCEYWRVISRDRTALAADLLEQRQAAPVPVAVADRLPELRGMFERILCVARSSGGRHVGNIELADRLIKAVVFWGAMPLPQGEVQP